MSDQKLRNLEEIRERISAKKREILELERAPIPASDIEARIDHWISLEAGRVKESSLKAHLQAPSSEYRLGDLMTLICKDRGSADLALLCWLDPARVKSRLLAVCPTDNDDARRVPLAARPKLKMKFERELFGLEVDEENLICELEESGMDVFRRADCDPTIVLGTREGWPC